MVRRCIGIDIGSSYLRAVQIAHTAEELLVEKVFSTQTRRSTDSLPEILRSLISEHEFDQRADVAVSMPPDKIFFRILEADPAELEHIRLHGLSALENHFPIPRDEIIIQAYSYHRLSGDKFSVLTAAASRKSLHEQLSILAQAKLRPKLVDATIFAIHSVVSVHYPEIAVGAAIIAYIDEHHLALAVTLAGNILAVRNIPTLLSSDNSPGSVREQVAELLSQEMNITWRKAFASGISPDSKLYLVTIGSVSNGLEAALGEKLPCQTIMVDPHAKLSSSTNCEVDVTMCVAEGLALRILAPEKTAGINFLEADDADVKPKFNLKKELAFCVALVGAIALIWVVSLFMRLSRLEANYARMKNEIREVFQSTLPEEKNIVSPLVQLEQKLASFRKDYQLFGSFYPGSLSPLEVLYSITVNTPSNANIRVDDLLVAADTVRVRGTCDSFESVYQWRRLLQDVTSFALAEVQDVQKEHNGGAVHFTILLSSATTEQK